MQININQNPQVQPSGNKKGRVVIGQLKKETVRLDADGNTIDPRTKRVIKLGER